MQMRVQQVIDEISATPVAANGNHKAPGNISQMQGRRNGTDRNGHRWRRNNPPRIVGVVVMHP